MQDLMEAEALPNVPARRVKHTRRRGEDDDDQQVKGRYVTKCNDR
jgi:hypothetical protein